MDASDEDEGDESEEEDRGDGVEAEDEPENAVEQPAPVRPPKRPVPVVIASPGKRTDDKSPPKKHKTVQPEPHAVHPIKANQSAKDKPTSSPVQADRPRIPKFPTIPLSASQAIQAGLQAKRTFSSLAVAKFKLKLKKPEKDSELAAAAQMHAELEADLHKNDDIEVDHLQPDDGEEPEDGEVSEGTQFYSAIMTVNPCAQACLWKTTRE